MPLRSAKYKPEITMTTKGITLILPLLICGAIFTSSVAESAPSDAELIAETERMIESYKLTNHAGLLGVILLETFLRPDSPEFLKALRTLLPPPSVEEVLRFSGSEKTKSHRLSRSKIDHIDLVAFEYFSSEAAGLTFLSVGDDGPIAIEVRFFVSPGSPEKPMIDSIELHETWEEIRNCFSVQRKLPGSLSVTGNFQRNAQVQE
jgi:hypothetical protein